MPPDQRALVDRDREQIFKGYRRLFAGTEDPAWRVEQASASLDLAPEAGGRTFMATSTARLRVRSLRASRWLGLEVPALQPHPLDAGGDHFVTGWRVSAVREETGAPVRWTVVNVDGDTLNPFRPDRRLVLVSWPDALPEGAVRTLQVEWSQQVPYASADLLHTRGVTMGTSTPAMPALPTVSGDGGAFPYGLHVTAPPGVVVAASGAPREGSTANDARTIGRVGGAAVVIAGPYSADERDGFRLLSARPMQGAAGQLDALRGRMRAWADQGLGAVAVAQLAAGWRFPAARWGEGVTGIRTTLRPNFATAYTMVHRLPRTTEVLVAEGVAGAAWAERAGTDPEATAWVRAFARAFALDQVDGGAAIAWRADMQRCATPIPGQDPALSPYLTANSGFRDLSERCAAPLVLGPMLTDRLGAAGARRVRAAALGGGLVRAAALRDAVLAVDPTAADWVDRWVLDARVPRVEGRMEKAREADGWRVRGVVAADGGLAGAPVVVRFETGLRCRDVVVTGSDERVAFEVALPFAPGRMRVDPEHRLLRRNSEPVEEEPEERGCPAG